MTKNRGKLINSFRTRAAIALIALAAATSGAYAAWRSWIGRIVASADSDLRAARPSLAAETVEPYRGFLLSDPHSCVVVIMAYYLAHRTERLGWASEKCLANGIEIPEAHIGRAAFFQFTGRENSALEYLAAQVSKFPKSPDLILAISELHEKLKHPSEAADAMARAAELAPERPILRLQAVQQYSHLKKWEEAARVADTVSEESMNSNPRIMLLLARALRAGGRSDKADGLIAKAKQVILTKPEIKAAAEEEYSDLLGKNPHD